MIDLNAIPNSWDLKKLGDVANFLNGRAFKPTEWETTGYQIIRIQNLNNPNLSYNNSSKEYEDRFKVENGDLLFAWSASLGAYIWTGKKAWLNQHIFKVKPKEFCEKKYLFYFLDKIISELYAKAHGSGMVHVTKGIFESTIIPVPSLSIQSQIVSKIEELFSELDKGKQQLVTVKQQLKTYRQAVLKWAFEGRFTSLEAVGDLSIDNKKNLALPKGWKWMKLGEVCNGVEYGSSSKSKEFGKVPVLRMGNIQKGRFDLTDLVYTSDEKETSKYLLKKDDVLFNRTNSPEWVGKTAIFKVARKAIFAGYLIRINRIDDLINADYLNYFLNSEFAKQYGNSVKTDGVNQSNINGQKLKGYPIPICSLNEQMNVVQEIETRLSVCDKLEEIIETSLQQAESLRQSILKQAFEGKLVESKS